MRRFFPEICGVECESRDTIGPKFDVFTPEIWGRAAPKFVGAFVNRHHFRPNDQVWLRFHGWSFIYADKINKKQITAIKYNGLAFGGYKNMRKILWSHTREKRERPTIKKKGRHTLSADNTPCCQKIAYL